MGRAYGMYRGEKKNIEDYDGQTRTETTWITTGRWTGNIKMVKVIPLQAQCGPEGG